MILPVPKPRQSTWISVAGLSLLLASSVGGQGRPTVDIRIDATAAHLSRASAIRVTADGTVLVGQPDECAVALFAANGIFLRKIGKKGDALGDFNSLGPFGTTGDTLWITDGKTRRVTSFLLSGKVLQSVGEAPSRMAAARALIQSDSVTARSLVSFDMPSAVGSGGRGVVMPGVSDEALAWGGVTRLPLLAVSKTGAPTAVLGWLPRIHSVLAIRGIAGVSSFESITDQPFGDDPQFGLSPDGNRVVIASSTARGSAATIRLLSLAPTGDTIATHSVAVSAAPLARRAVDSAAHAIALERKELEHESLWRAAIYAPPIYPVVTRVRTGDDGTVWLRSFLTGGQYRWTVVSPGGQVIGAVDLPESTNVMTIDASGAWSVEHPANGPEAVIHVRRPAAGRSAGGWPHA